MPRREQQRTTLSAGQIDDAVRNRLDVDLWQRAVADAKNNMPLIEGGIRRRWGSDLLKDLTDSLSADARIEAFEFNADQVYLVAFDTDGDWFVLDDEGDTVDSGTGGPWTSAAMVEELDVSQEGDVMVIAHEDFPTRLLRRTGASSFQLELFTFDENTEGTQIKQPYYRFASGNIYIQPDQKNQNRHVVLSSVTGTFVVGETVNGTSGTATLRAFKVEGSTVHLITSNGSFSGTITGATSGATGTLVSQNGDYGGKLNASDDVFVASDEGSVWRLNYVLENAALDELDPTWYEFEIYRVVNATEAYGLWRRELPTWDDLKGGSSTNVAYARPEYEQMPWWTGTPTGATRIPTDIWEEPVASERRGYFKSVSFHNQRLCLAGHKELQPFGWISRVGAFFDFDLGDGIDDEAIVFICGTGVGHKIQYVRSSSQLVILTDKAAFTIPESPLRPLTPENAAPKLIPDAPGSAKVKPAIFDGALVYTQKNNVTVREVRVEVESNGSQSVEASALNLIASSLITGAKRMVSIAYSPQRPEQYLFVLNEDGSIALFHGNIAENVNSWFKWTTEGSWLHAATINDEVYVYTSRTVNGSTYRFLERLNPDRTLDCVITSSGAASNTHTGFDAFDDHGVSVVDGEHDFYFGELEPDSGTITLPFDHEEAAIEAGFDFERVVTTLPATSNNPARGTETSSGRSSKKRLLSAHIDIRNGAALTIQGRKVSLLNTADLNNPLDKFNGIFKAGLRGWSYEGALTLTWDAPLPCDVLALYWRVYF